MSGSKLVLLMLLVSGPLAAAVPPEPPPSTALKDVKELESRHLDSDPETWPGAKVYRGLCVNCHEGQVPKAPHRMFLQMMSPDVILAALTNGVMREQGATLAPQARRHSPTSRAALPGPGTGCGRVRGAGRGRLGP